MVKKLLLFLLLLALPLLPISAVADIQVIDDANVIDAEMEQKITRAIEVIEAEYQIDLVVLVTYDVPDDYSDSLWRVEEFADNYYDNNGYGFGVDSTGMLYLLDLNNYVQWVSTCGELADDMTDAEIDRILDAAQPYLRDDQYGGGALAVVEEIGELMDEWRAGARSNSDHVGQRDGNFSGKVGFLEIFAAIIVFLSLGGMPAW